MRRQNPRNLAIRLLGAATVAAVAMLHAPVLSAQARATVQVSVTIVPAVQPLPLVRDVERLVSADSTTTQRLSADTLGGLARVRTQIEPARSERAQRQATVTIEYGAN